MKSVLISTRPNWCEKICRKIGEENGIPVYLKPVEVRKSAPKEVPFKAYLYCSNGRFDITDIDDLTSESVRVVSEGRGKVIGEFVCNKVERLPAFFERTDGTCLTVKELDKYGSNRKGELFYWHISDLKIYDEPKELRKFRKPCNWNYDCCTCKRAVYELTKAKAKLFYGCDREITRPPQSWQYIEPLDK